MSGNRPDYPLVPGHEVTQEQINVLASLMDQTVSLCRTCEISEDSPTALGVLQLLQSVHQQNKMDRINREIRERTEKLMAGSGSGVAQPGTRINPGPAFSAL